MADNGNGLIVPIRVEALLVGKADAQGYTSFAAPDAMFNLLGTKAPYPPYIGQTVATQPFQSAGGFPAGIHLHWNLPKSLRAGDVQSDGTVAAPPVANRWLVTRVSRTGSSVVYTGWVVESDFLSANSDYSYTTVPDGTSFQYIGRAWKLEDWISGGNRGIYFPGLTALGYGIPTFSSCYLNCAQVFGFYDPSPGADTPDGNVSYVVTGWYQDPALDPVASSSSFGWQFTGDPAPTFSLCYGAICGIQYDTSASKKYLSDTPIVPDIAIGNNPVEALSALLVSFTGTTTDPTGSGARLEPLLNALQFGLLKALGQPDGLAKADAGLFEQSFSIAETGSRWDIRPTETANVDSPYQDLSPEVSGALATLLVSLNNLQREYDSAVSEKESLQLQIFADWTKFSVLEYGPDSAVAQQYPDLMNQLYTYLTSTEIPACNELNARISGLQSQIETLQQEIASQLADVPTLELVNVMAPSFHAPADPAVVITGAGVVAPPPDYAQAIACALENELVSGVTLPGATVQASQLPSDPSWAQLPYAALGTLVQTTVLLDPNLSAVVVAAAGTAVSDPASAAQYLSAAQTQFLVETGSQNSVSVGSVTISGQFPQGNIALRTWEAEPWNPLTLEWRFSMEPLATDSTGYPATFITDSFSMERGQLNYEVGGDASFSGVLQEYAGKAWLSGKAASSLLGQLQQYLQHFPDSDLSGIVGQLQSQPILAQTLGGFSDSLNMLAPAMQFPVTDPHGALIYANLAKTVAGVVGDRNSHTALPNNSYNPIRAGKITMRDLMLVDEFGRCASLDLSKLKVAAGISTLPAASGEPPIMVPPLRIAQNSQLIFDWLSSADATSVSTSLPATSPICGWVVPNHLNSSLALYDGAGDSIGSLTPATGSSQVIWQSAPGTGSPGTPLADSMANANPVLAGFASNVVAQGSDYLKDFIRTLDSTQSSRIPARYAENVGTAVLIGAPLALLQARLDMQLLGMPAPDQSYAALNSDVTAPHASAANRTVNGFPNVLFPVVLGHQFRVDDGLIGYFLQKRGTNGVWSTDYSKFYAQDADGRNQSIVNPEPSPIALTPLRGSDPAILTLLMDPRGPVHAHNGVSPMQTLNVPQGAAAFGLSRMTFTFLTSPVLSLPSSLPIPVPVEANGDWTFTGYAGGSWRETKPAQLNTEMTVQNAGRVIEGWLKLTPKLTKPEGSTNAG